MIGLWLLGCGADGGTLTVLAASSLTEAFSELAEGFEAEHPGVEVAVSFAGSQALAAQIRHGIAADVFASADAVQVEALASEGRVGAPRPFASNALVLAVSASAPEGIGLERLPELERLVVGAPEVPVGRYTAELLDAAGTRYGSDWREAVEARVVSREPSVRLALAKVALGEADAAVVYATDAASAEGVRAVPLPAGLAPAASYHHARLAEAPEPELARLWMARVEGEAGQQVLARWGFGAAPP